MICAWMSTKTNPFPYATAGWLLGWGGWYKIHLWNKNYFFFVFSVFTCIFSPSHGFATHWSFLYSLINPVMGEKFQERHKTKCQSAFCPKGASYTTFPYQPDQNAGIGITSAPMHTNPAWRGWAGVSHLSSFCIANRPAWCIGSWGVLLKFIRLNVFGRLGRGWNLCKKQVQCCMLQPSDEIPKWKKWNGFIVFNNVFKRCLSLNAICVLIQRCNLWWKDK